MLWFFYNWPQNVSRNAMAQSIYMLKPLSTLQTEQFQVQERFSPMKRDGVLQRGFFSAHHSFPLYPAPISLLSVSSTLFGSHPLLYFINLPATVFYSLTRGPLRVHLSGVFPIALFLSILLHEVTHPSPPLQCYYLLALLCAERVVPPPLGVWFHTLSMSTSSATPSNLSIDTLTLELGLSDSTRESPDESPLTSCPDSPKSNSDDYFIDGPKIPSPATKVEPSYPKVNNVCFVGAGFVGM